MRRKTTSPRRKDLPVTLHDELVQILEVLGNEWKSTQELADEVNRRGNYKKKMALPLRHSRYTVELDSTSASLRNPDRGSG
jgi:hypothetical protein